MPSTTRMEYVTCGHCGGLITVSAEQAGYLSGMARTFGWHAACAACAANPCRSCRKPDVNR